MTVNPQHISTGVPAPWSPRPRAGLACQECCRRKVRCDVEKALMPCTNCKLDGVQCVVRPCKRTRGAREHRIRKVICKSNCVQGVSKKSIKPVVCLDQPSAAQPPNEALSWDLPGHFPSPPAHLDAADLAYLKSKRALEIPDGALQKVLLQSYLSHVHDFLPIIDLHHLVLVLLSGAARSDTASSPAPLSLFVYQAVMFASVGSVPLTDLVKAGFKSRVEARTVFAGKVKALYNVGFETDHTCLVQGLLTLAYWQDFSSCPKQFSYWVNVSWSLLQAMVPSEDGDSPQQSDSQIPYRVYGQQRMPIRLYRRMYWSCFLISRVVALASHAPVTLVWPENSHSHPGYLQLGDFNIAPVSEALLLGCGLDMGIVSAENQKTVAQLHIAVVEMCLRFGDAVRNPVSLQHGETQAALDACTELDEHIQSLFASHNSFPAIVSERPGATVAAFGPQPALVLHQSIPIIILHTALSSLLSQQTILLDTTAICDGPTVHEARKKIQDRRFLATSTVTATFTRLKAQGLLHCLPPCIMALLLPATVAQFTRRLSDPDPFSRILNEQYLTEAFGIFCEMGDVTPCARRWAEVFVELFEKHESRKRERGWFGWE